MSAELRLRGIAFQRQHRFSTLYKGEVVGEGRVDLLVANSVVVELKAVGGLLPIHQAQFISYLKALNKQLGPLLNFNVSVMKSGIRRVVYNP